MIKSPPHDLARHSVLAVGGIRRFGGCSAPSRALEQSDGRGGGDVGPGHGGVDVSAGLRGAASGRRIEASAGSLLAVGQLVDGVFNLAAEIGLFGGIGLIEVDPKLVEMAPSGERAED